MNFTFSRTRGKSAKTGAAADEEIIAAPGAGVSIAVYDITFSSSANCDFQVTEGADAAGTRIMDEYFHIAGQARCREFSPPYVLPAATALNYTTSAGNSKIVVHYTTV